MKFIPIYILFLLVAISNSVYSQGADSKKKKATKKTMDERVTLKRNETSPYGTYYAYENLRYIFPEAEIVVDNDAPGEKKIFAKKIDELNLKIGLNKGKSVRMVISPKVVPSEEEVEAMMSFVYEGNTVFVSSFNLGEIFLKKLGLATHYSGGWADFADSLKIDLINPVSYASETFFYPGKRYDNSFSDYNKNTTEILGRNKKGDPNFIRIKYTGGGSIYVHLAPLAFSNFFLLHKNNKSYYDAVFSYLPSDTKLIAWSEYFRTKEPGNSTSRAFSFMMKHPPLASALWLMLLMFILIYIFESKRKQKMIPVRPQLKNSSLEFVKTIGRLYFQRHDNKNLSAKMTAHFLDHVRTKYNLPTSQMDEGFIKKLSFKSGIEFKIVYDLIYQSNYLNNKTFVSDLDLQNYNQHLENFYKKS